MEMHPVSSEGNFSDDDSSGGEVGDGYTSMSPLSEMSAGLSRSLELLDKESSNLDNKQDLSKSLSLSNVKVRITGSVALALI